MTDDPDPFEEARLEELADIPIADMSDDELGILEAECLSIGGRRGGRLRAALFELRRRRRPSEPSVLAACQDLHAIAMASMDALPAAEMLRLETYLQRKLDGWKEYPAIGGCPGVYDATVKTLIMVALAEWRACSWNPRNHQAEAAPPRWDDEGGRPINPDLAASAAMASSAWICPTCNDPKCGEV